MENVVNKITYSEKNESLNSFYPEIQPYKTELFKVSDIHTLYVEQSGNPKGRPVVFLHGGPGGGTNSDHRRFLLQNTIASFYSINEVLVDQHPPRNSKKTQRGI